MNELATIPSVRHMIVVEAPREHAFEVFTRGIDTWWFRDHSIGTEPLKEVVMEPREVAACSSAAFMARNATGAAC